VSIFLWPCFHARCSKRGSHVVRIEYGDQAEHEVGIRLCREHRDSWTAWFEAGTRLTLEKVYTAGAADEPEEGT
jgi:nicotinic acid phosphoribosyltransferase